MCCSLKKKKLEKQLNKGQKMNISNVFKKYSKQMKKIDFLNS